MSEFFEGHLHALPAFLAGACLAWMLVRLRPRWFGLVPRERAQSRLEELKGVMIRELIGMQGECRNGSIGPPAIRMRAAPRDGDRGSGARGQPVPDPGVVAPSTPGQKAA